MALRRWYELDRFLMRNNERHKLVRKICIIGENFLSDHKPKKMTLIIEKPMTKKIIYKEKNTKDKLGETQG